MVKNKDEWLASHKKLKEHKKRGAKEGRANDEAAEFGFPMGGFEEQIERFLDAARRKRRIRRTSEKNPSSHSVE